MYGQAQEVVVDIMSRYNELFAYNFHLEARLKSIKGFESTKGAERFLNAWMVRRRTKPFTDCGVPLKHLNGFCSLQMSMKKEAQWPQILGVKKPKKKVK